MTPGEPRTLCALDAATFHEWPLLDFPRAYGSHCPACVAVTGTTIRVD